MKFDPCVIHVLFFMLSRLFTAALWSPAGKGLTSWLLFGMLNCVFVTSPCGILGQVWYLILSIPDICGLFYFYSYIKVLPWLVRLYVKIILEL